jgi:hypothetical protein
VRKLRPFYDDETLARIYSVAYDHTVWPEHRERVDDTVRITQRLIDAHDIKTAADWSAGDRAITGRLIGLTLLDTADGDLARALRENVDQWDLFICTETIEHLEAPWTVLEEIAKITRFIVLSTPLDEQPDIDNYEHYWSFTQHDVRDLLEQAGFVDLHPTYLTGSGWTYTYQVWTGRSK